MEYSLSICNTLHDDHMMTVGMLEKLESTLTRIGPKAPPEGNDPELSRLLTDLTAIMQSEITSHFSFEEEHLFPRAEEFGAGDMVAVLQGEHDIIRPLAGRITEAVKEARTTGFTLDTWPVFYDMGLELAERETFHIQKEEMAFLAMLDQMLDPEEDAELTMAFANAR